MLRCTMETTAFAYSSILFPGFAIVMRSTAKATRFFPSIFGHSVEAQYRVGVRCSNQKDISWNMKANAVERLMRRMIESTVMTIIRNNNNRQCGNGIV